jgi:hypothetical protein
MGVVGEFVLFAHVGHAFQEFGGLHNFAIHQDCNPFFETQEHQMMGTLVCFSDAKQTPRDVLRTVSRQVVKIGRDRGHLVVLARNIRGYPSIQHYLRHVVLFAIHPGFHDTVVMRLGRLERTMLFQCRQYIFCSSQILRYNRLGKVVDQRIKSNDVRFNA